MEKKDRKILIIDDEKDIRNLISKVLNKRGYSVYEAEDGYSALVKCKEFDFDLIMLDINLPDINGFDLYKILLQDQKTKDIPVIVISVSARRDEMINFIQEGVKDYILKGRDLIDSLVDIERYFPVINDVP